MQKVATYQAYMDSHKNEILELIEMGWQVKQIARLLKRSSTTLSNYMYQWGNGHKKHRGGYLAKIKQVAKLPLMDRISSETKAKMAYNTAANNERIEYPKDVKNFYGDEVVNEILDKKYGGFGNRDE